MSPIKNDFNDLRNRVFSAIILSVVAAYALFSGGLVATAFLAICFLILNWEMYYIFSEGTIKWNKGKVIVLIFSPLIPFLSYFDFYPLLVLLFYAIASAYFSDKKILKFMCSLYLGFSIIVFHNILLFNDVNFNLFYLLFLLLMVASSDVGGYFIGKFIGGPKIYTSISPNKTWSGSLGGVGFALVMCFFFKSLLIFSLIEIMIIGVTLALAAQIGDLFESWLKRKFKVKDSGFLLPGHGGFFDRLDGLLAATPVYKGLLYLFY